MGKIPAPNSPCWHRAQHEIVYHGIVDGLHILVAAGNSRARSAPHSVRQRRRGIPAPYQPWIAPNARPRFAGNGRELACRITSPLIRPPESSRPRRESFQPFVLRVIERGGAQLHRNGSCVGRRRAKRARRAPAPSQKAAPHRSRERSCFPHVLSLLPRPLSKRPASDSVTGCHSHQSRYRSRFAASYDANLTALSRREVMMSGVRLTVRVDFGSDRALGPGKIGSRSDPQDRLDLAGRPLARHVLSARLAPGRRTEPLLPRTGRDDATRRRARRRRRAHAVWPRTDRKISFDRTKARRRPSAVARP